MIINCTIEELKEYLQERMMPKRYLHSLGVADCARALAVKNDVNTEFAYIAGLLHDCGRTMTDEQMMRFAEEENIGIGAIEMLQPVLLHASCGAIIAARYFGVQEESILRSIANHTTGDEGMSVLEKVVSLADMIEPERKFDGVKKMRKLALKSLDSALIFAYDTSIKYVLGSGKLLHPKTLAARNELLITRGKGDDSKKTTK